MDTLIRQLCEMDAVTLKEIRHFVERKINEQMRFIMCQVLDIFRDKLPVIVEDIRSDSDD